MIVPGGLIAWLYFGKQAGGARNVIGNPAPPSAAFSLGSEVPEIGALSAGIGAYCHAGAGRLPPLALTKADSDGIDGTS